MWKLEWLSKSSWKDKMWSSPWIEIKEIKLKVHEWRKSSPPVCWGSLLLKQTTHFGQKGRLRAWGPWLVSPLTAAQSTLISGLSAELPRNSTYFYLLECGLKTTVLFQPSHLKNVEKLEAQRQEMPKVSGLVNGQAGVRTQIIWFPRPMCSLLSHAAFLMLELTN